MTDSLTGPRLARLCRDFARQRIVVVGDVMLDHYLHGEVRRISPEAPVPVVEFQSEQHLPGGAANVAGNLVALGAKADLIGVVGRDPAARLLARAIRRTGLDPAGLIPSPDRCTTVKTRVVAHQVQMLRLDRETRQPLSPAIRSRLLQRLRSSLRGAAAVIVADYAKGVLDRETITAILTLGRKAGVPVCIDPKPSRPLKFKGSCLLTPNRREAFELAGLPDMPVGIQPARDRGLRRAMDRIWKLYRPDILLVTLGEAGMVVQEKGGELQHLPTAARTVYDVSGAGDTVIATFVLARSAGASVIEAAGLANLAAGIVVGKPGVATVSRRELADWAGR
jgi:D-glycero-beta-D-manno-heptose-7-phosphate kinase